jgi:hypothetical protein
MARTNGVKPIQEAHEISAITCGFMAKALFAALEFDLFTQISRGGRFCRRIDAENWNCMAPLGRAELTSEGSLT